MNEKEQQAIECHEYRDSFDELNDQLAPMSAQRQSALTAHGKQCTSCASWREQTEQLIDMAEAMPQFDVSEALTQRILTAVELERTVRAGSTTPYLVPLAAVTAILLFAWIPFETVDGVVSWVLGAAGLAGLKLLITTPGAADQTA